MSNDLMDLITAYRAKKLDVIPMRGVNGALDYLRDLGYDIDIDGIMDVMSRPEFTGNDGVVERSDPNSIKLRPYIPEPKIGTDKKVKDDEKIEKVAAAGAEKAVKSGDMDI